MGGFNQRASPKRTKPKSQIYSLNQSHQMPPDSSQPASSFPLATASNQSTQNVFPFLNCKAFPLSVCLRISANSLMVSGSPAVASSVGSHLDNLHLFPQLGLFLTIIQQSKHNYVHLQMGKTDAQKGQVVSPNT